jgi:hypothetical protein
MSGGNTGHTGHTGHTGNTGAVGLGTLDGLFFPDRVDLPFVTEAGKATIQHGDLVDPNKPFREGTARWIAWEIMARLLRSKWEAKVLTTVPHWTKLMEKQDPSRPGQPLYPGQERTVEKEIERLVRYAEDERPDALGEILSQDGEWTTEYMNLLAMTPATHPHTHMLLQVTALVATACVLQVKAHYRRRRPSQVWPALYPPVPVPNHSSYPSGHATIAWLMTIAIKDVRGLAGGSALAKALDTLAARIGRNREIAGLHYPSDTEAGKRLAEHLWKRLQKITDLEDDDEEEAEGVRDQAAGDAGQTTPDGPSKKKPIKLNQTITVRQLRERSKKEFDAPQEAQ